MERLAKTKQILQKSIALSAYIRFLHLIDVIDSTGGWKKLDPLEESLLNKLVLMATKQDEPILVKDLISIVSIASQATLHGRVKSLERKGLINLIADQDDARKKHVYPTQLAMKRYEMLSDNFERALGSAEQAYAN